MPRSLLRLNLLFLAAVLPCIRLTCSSAEKNADGWHVWPGDDIQEAIKQATTTTNKQERVHAGEYRPRTNGIAMVWLNAKHDGLHLVAEGEVILTAENPTLLEKDSEGYPSAV